MKKALFCFSLLISMSITAHAQILTPAHWSYKASKDKIQPGDIIDLVFKIKLDKSWHLYSNIQNYKNGPIPTVFKFESNTGYKLVGKIVPINSKKKYDKIFEVSINYFEDTAEFRQKVKIISKNPVIKGSYTYQVCTTVDGKCILGDDEFEFKINDKK